MDKMPPPAVLLILHDEITCSRFVRFVVRLALLLRFELFFFDLHPVTRLSIVLSKTVWPDLFS